jgi:hypothetical protein
MPAGFGVSVSGNITRAIAIVGDVSYNWDRSSNFLGGPDFKSHSFIFLTGPRFYIRGDKITFFGQFMLGLANTRDEFSQRLMMMIVKDTNFALGFGSGMDVNLSNRISLRLFQFDYIPTHRSGDWQDNFRIKTGIVFRFGHYR